ncbi:retrovirus-related pol polyprotein from transposon TNT 1-94 [Tanacetum coccineum]
MWLKGICEGKESDSRDSDSLEGCQESEVSMIFFLIFWIAFGGRSVAQRWVTKNKECKIRGIGKVRIQLRDGSSCAFTLCHRVVLSGIQSDNCVYSLDGHAMAGDLNASVEEKDSLAQIMFLGKVNIESGFVLGRHTTQGVIDYVHSDLWGPSQVESLGGKRYFLSIVDDYSRRVWVYILRFKHVAFGKFKEWKQLVENPTGRTVKKLRTDNGLEFCNQEFKQLCLKIEILSRRYKSQCCSLIPAKSDSLPHAHTQALKVNHLTSRLLLLNKNVIVKRDRGDCYPDEEEAIGSFQDKYEVTEEDPEEDPKEDSEVEDEPNEETETDLDSTVRSEAKPKELEDTCKRSVRPKLDSPQTIPAYMLPDYPSRHSFF